MSTLDHQDEPAFARGIAGPLGKLTEDLKTKVDETTDQVFRQPSFSTMRTLISSFMSAPPGNGCVEAPIVCPEVAGTPTGGTPA